MILLKQRGKKKKPTNYVATSKGKKTLMSQNETVNIFTFFLVNLSGLYVNPLKQGPIIVKPAIAERTISLSLFLKEPSLKWQVAQTLPVQPNLISILSLC